MSAHYLYKIYPNWSSGVSVGSFTQLYNNLVMEHEFGMHAIFEYGKHYLVLVNQRKENSVYYRDFHYYHNEQFKGLVEINSHEFEIDVHEKLDNLLIGA